MTLRILGNNGPYPASGGACSSYLLSSGSGNTNIIIDFGTGALSALRSAISYDKIDAVILSHLHFDHMSDMLPMQYALQFHPRSPLPVYAPATPEKVHALLEAPCYALHEIKAVNIGEMEISFLAVRHPVETYAVRVACDGKIFVYTGDTNTLPALDAFAADADLLLADAGLSTADWKESAPHLSAALCGELAARCGAKSLLLSHLNSKYTADAHVQEAKSAFKNVRFTETGAEYII